MTIDAIGVFDSGVGGLTVVKELVSLMPHENIIYFGDTARVPYGTKSADTILRYSIENSIFLLKHKVKCIVVACNTASAYALTHLQQVFKVPVIGVIIPGAEAALEASRNKKIAVIGTTATMRSEAYQQELLRQNPHAEILTYACPLFVPLVEEGLFHHEATRLLIKEYLNPVLNSTADTLLLGCTHYPLLANQIREIAGPEIAIIDSAKACAKAVSKTLESRQLCGNTQQIGANRFFVSDDPQKFQSMATQFFGSALAHIEIAKP